MVTRQLQVERRTAKKRWPETDVLPLSHADQPEGKGGVGREGKENYFDLKVVLTVYCSLLYKMCDCCVFRVKR